MYHVETNTETYRHTGMGTFSRKTTVGLEVGKQLCQPSIHQHPSLTRG